MLWKKHWSTQKLHKIYVKDIPEAMTVDSYLREKTDIARVIKSMNFKYPDMLEVPHTLDMNKLRQSVDDAYNKHGWWGFLIHNFGEGYGDKDKRSERLGGLSITYNPYYWQDLPIQCQTLGNRKFNLPPNMYAGPFGNSIFERVNIHNVRGEFFLRVNNQGAGVAWKYLYDSKIITPEEYFKYKTDFEKCEYDPRAKNQTGKHTYSDALSFNKLTPACTEGYLGEVFSQVKRTICRGRIIEMKWGDIHWHRDEDYYTNFRINFPLYFDPSTKISTEKTQKHMKPGYMYHLDTGNPHAVVRVSDDKYRRVNIILGVSPWFDYDEQEDCWISNQFYGEMHPVDMFLNGHIVDFIGGKNEKVFEDINVLYDRNTANLLR